MADSESQFKPFGYFLVTWLLLVWSARRQDCDPAEPVSSSAPNSPLWVAPISTTTPIYPDEE